MLPNKIEVQQFNAQKVLEVSATQPLLVAHAIARNPTLLPGLSFGVIDNSCRDAAAKAILLPVFAEMAKQYRHTCGLMEDVVMSMVLPAFEE